MKKLLLFLFLSAGAQLSQAQQLLKLDSVVTDNYAKVFYTYDSTGEVLESIHHDWNTSAGDWVLKSKWVFNNTGSEEVLTIFSWNANSLEWIPYRQRVINHTASASTNTYNSWNAAIQMWNPLEQSTIINNPEGQVIQRIYIRWQLNSDVWEWGERYTVLETPTSFEEIYETWDVDIQDWQFIQKTEYWLNTEGRLSQSIIYWWDENQWVFTVDSRRTTFLYDANGNIIENTSYARDPADTAWIGWIRTINTYNWDDVLTSITYYFFDPANDTWFFHQLDKTFTHTYSPEGWLEEILEKRWRNAENALVNYKKSIYAYDVAGNQIDHTSFLWNIASGYWYGTSREIRTYDLSVDVADLVFPDNDTNNRLFKNGKLVSQEAFSINPDSNDWEIYLKACFYFSELVTATEEAPTTESIKLFPNPVSNLLTLGANAHRTSSYQITDLNGRILQQEKSWNGAGIDVSQLIPGSYVIRLIEGNRIITGKFIKL
ncbi:MAG: T9SS type A sorting domain-containing protein [Saprospiraceae bacterium]